MSLSPHVDDIELGISVEQFEECFSNVDKTWSDKYQLFYWSVKLDNETYIVLLLLVHQVH